MEITNEQDVWEQAKAKYSLCNRCTKQPNCDDGKRNLYMNACSRFVDVVDIPQADSNEFYNMDALLRKQMREPTTEELETFDNYIKSISSPTGVNFWELSVVIPNKAKPKHWIHRNDDYNDWLECPNCGYGSEGEVKYGEGTPFCPHCGERLEEE